MKRTIKKLIKETLEKYNYDTLYKKFKAQEPNLEYKKFQKYINRFNKIKDEKYHHINIADKYIELGTDTPLDIYSYPKMDNLVSLVDYLDSIKDDDNFGKWSFMI